MEVEDVYNLRVGKVTWCQPLHNTDTIARRFNIIGIFLNQYDNQGWMHQQGQ